MPDLGAEAATIGAGSLPNETAKHKQAALNSQCFKLLIGTISP
jgi:hypothetical protein